MYKALAFATTLVALTMAPGIGQAQSDKAEVASYPIRISDYLGKPVGDGSGQTLGTIVDMVLDARNEVAQVVLALPPVPGEGGRRVAVPFEVVGTYGSEICIL